MTAKELRCLATALLVLVCGCNRTLGAAVAQVESADTYHFVFHELEIDAADSSPSAGFNLDGLFSTETENSGCNVADRASDLDLDQNQDGCAPGMGCQGGVDNALPKVVHLLDAAELNRTHDARSDLTASVDGGRSLFLLRITQASSLVNDASVGVSLYRGHSTDTSCSALFAGSGNFVAHSGWVSSNDFTQPLVTATGSITNGRLDVTFGSNPTLPLLASGLFATLKLRVSLAANGSSGSAGNIGGRFDGPKLLALLGQLFAYKAYSLNDILPLLSDLPPATGSCGESPGYPLIALGLGMRFSLAQATISGVASAPPEGACGSL